MLKKIGYFVIIAAGFAAAICKTFPEERYVPVLIMVAVCLLMAIISLFIMDAVFSSKKAEKILLNEAAWRINARREIGEKEHPGDRALIMEYMQKNNILSCVLDNTVWNLEIEKAKELPADLRVRKILLEMDYMPDKADNKIRKAKNELGEKCRFDEMLKFCLED